MSIDARLQTYGKVFENWTIREKIGQGSGGKSAVFLLKRKNLTYEETCVMKVVNIIEQRGSYNETASSLRRDYGEVKRQLCNAAENEVSLMYELRGSGNIVNYLDYHFEEWEDRISFGVDLLIRMDYLSSLGNLIRTRTLSENEILRIGRDISNALMNCHARNIIHRDIKPDNIFYDQYGAYLLGDFGISRMLENSKRAETRTGTEPYAAPEQFAGGFMGHVQTFLKKVIPNVLQYFLIPVFTLVITLPVTLFLFGPIGTWIGEGISFLCTLLANTLGNYRPVA